MMRVILFQKTIADRFGEARYCSYIYRVNEARSRVAVFKNKGYVKRKSSSRVN